MSADIRERFKNDPAEMISFLEDENNLPEAIKLGMVTTPEKVDKLNEEKSGEEEKPAK